MRGIQREHLRQFRDGLRRLVAPAAKRLAGESCRLQGSLRQLRLVDLIQVKCLSHDSCKLHITGANGVHGVIVINGGSILHAETDNLSGIPAFNEMLSWTGGVFYEEEFRGGVEVNIEGRWEMVLMEAVRLSDECHALRAA